MFKWNKKCVCCISLQRTGVYSFPPRRSQMEKKTCFLLRRWKTSAAAVSESSFMSESVIYLEVAESLCNCSFFIVYSKRNTESDVNNRIQLFVPEVNTEQTEEEEEDQPVKN